MLRGKNEAGWFVTGDRLLHSGSTLHFKGRNDTQIKILGERVELDSLQARIEALAGTDYAISAVADERSGWRIILVAGDGVPVDDALQLYNDNSLGIERAGASTRVAKIPRNDLGKLCREKLDQLLRASGA